jgi:hypothetical protein
MDLTPVLDQIRAAGVELGVRAGKLTCKAPDGALTPRRKAWLKLHEAELIELLQPPPPAPAGDEPIFWIDQIDVITVIKDLADEGMRPRRISSMLGLTTGEVCTILQRTGRWRVAKRNEMCILEV